MKLSPSEPVQAWAEVGSSHITVLTSTNMALDVFSTVEHKAFGVVLYRAELAQWDMVWVLWEDGRILLAEVKDLVSLL